MKEYEIIPHVGVGPIMLGMTRDEVHNIFGQPEHTSPDAIREGYFSGFMVDYNKNGIVEFIEIALSEHFKGIFKGECLHELPVGEALNFVSQFGKYDSNDTEPGYSYIFVELQIALWRGIVAGEDEDPNDDGIYFESISVGEDGYFEYSK